MSNEDLFCVYRKFSFPFETLSKTQLDFKPFLSRFKPIAQLRAVPGVTHLGPMVLPSRGVY